MPSSYTITAFNSFSAGTLIRSGAVNTNFANFRGHLLPIETDTATASDLVYDLGHSSYRWKRANVQEMVFSDHSTPASPITGQYKVYFKADGLPYYLNASGTESNFGGFVSPLTTKGDLHGYSTIDARVPVGTNGQVLTADSSATAGVSWKNVTPTYGVTTVSSDYSITSETFIRVNSSATTTIYLPTVTSNNGTPYRVKKIDSSASNTVLVVGANIDGTTTVYLYIQNDEYEFTSNGSSYDITSIYKSNVEASYYGDSPTGHASTTTQNKVRTGYTIVNNTLFPFATYSDTATLGAMVTVNVPGFYFVDYSDRDSGGSEHLAITVNCTAMNTITSSLTYAQGRRARGMAVSTNYGNATAVIYCSAGDIIRPHDDGGANDVGINSYFKVVYMGRKI